MTKSLPSQPNLEQLKNQAKDLLKSLKSGEADAIQRMRENHPRRSAASEPEMHAAELSFSDAQLVLAREYGFASPELAAYAIERGAVVDVHAAARLGMMEKLRELIEAEPALVNARGGDGQTPLHFATTIEVA